MRPAPFFSTRMALVDAIMVPGTVCERYRGEDWKEDMGHWQARAVLEVVQSEVKRSAVFREWLSEALTDAEAQSMRGEA